MSFNIKINKKSYITKRLKDNKKKTWTIKKKNYRQKLKIINRYLK